MHCKSRNVEYNFMNPMLYDCVSMLEFNIFAQD